MRWRLAIAAVVNPSGRLMAANMARKVTDLVECSTADDAAMADSSGDVGRVAVCLRMGPQLPMACKGLRAKLASQAHPIILSSHHLKTCAKWSRKFFLRNLSRRSQYSKLFKNLHV